MVELLLKNKANPNIKSVISTPYDAAVFRGKIFTIQFKSLLKLLNLNFSLGETDIAALIKSYSNGGMQFYMDNWKFRMKKNVDSIFVFWF